MKSLIGPWWMCTCDSVEGVSSAARHAWENTFKMPKKRQEVLTFLTPSICRFVRDSINAKVEGLSDLSSCSMDEADERFERVVTSCLRSLSILIASITHTPLPSSSDSSSSSSTGSSVDAQVALLECISGNFWKKLTGKRPAVRRATYCVLSSVCQYCPSLLTHSSAMETTRLTTIVCGAISSERHNSNIEFMLQALSLYSAAVSTCWENIDLTKHLFTPLIHLAHTYADVTLPALLPLVATVPIAFIKSRYSRDVLRLIESLSSSVSSSLSSTGSEMKRGERERFSSSLTSRQLTMIDISGYILIQLINDSQPCQYDSTQLSAQLEEVVTGCEEKEGVSVLRQSLCDALSHGIIGLLLHDSSSSLSGGDDSGKGTLQSVVSILVALHKATAAVTGSNKARCMSQWSDVLSSELQKTVIGGVCLQSHTQQIQMTHTPEAVAEAFFRTHSQYLIFLHKLSLLLQTTVSRLPATHKEEVSSSSDSSYSSIGIDSVADDLFQLCKSNIHMLSPSITDTAITLSTGENDVFLLMWMHTCVKLVPSLLCGISRRHGNTKSTANKTTVMRAVSSIGELLVHEKYYQAVANSIRNNTSTSNEDGSSISRNEKGLAVDVKKVKLLVKENMACISHLFTHLLTPYIECPAETVEEAEVADDARERVVGFLSSLLSCCLSNIQVSNSLFLWTLAVDTLHPSLLYLSSLPDNTTAEITQKRAQWVQRRLQASLVATKTHTDSDSIHHDVVIALRSSSLSTVTQFICQCLTLPYMSTVRVGVAEGGVTYYGGHTLEEAVMLLCMDGCVDGKEGDSSCVSCSYLPWVGLTLYRNQLRLQLKQQQVGKKNIVTQQQQGEGKEQKDSVSSGVDVEGSLSCVKFSTASVCALAVRAFHMDLFQQSQPSRSSLAGRHEVVGRQGDVPDDGFDAIVSYGMMCTQLFPLLSQLYGNDSAGSSVGGPSLPIVLTSIAVYLSKSLCPSPATTIATTFSGSSGSLIVNVESELLEPQLWAVGVCRLLTLCDLNGVTPLCASTSASDSTSYPNEHGVLNKRAAHVYSEIIAHLKLPTESFWENLYASLQTTNLVSTQPDTPTHMVMILQRVVNCLLALNTNNSVVGVLCPVASRPSLCFIVTKVLILGSTLGTDGTITAQQPLSSVAREGLMCIRTQLSSLSSSHVLQYLTAVIRYCLVSMTSQQVTTDNTTVNTLQTLVNWLQTIATAATTTTTANSTSISNDHSDLSSLLLPQQGGGSWAMCRSKMGKMVSTRVVLDSVLTSENIAKQASVHYLTTTTITTKEEGEKEEDEVSTDTIASSTTVRVCVIPAVLVDMHQDNPLEEPFYTLTLPPAGETGANREIQTVAHRILKHYTSSKYGVTGDVVNGSYTIPFHHTKDTTNTSTSDVSGSYGDIFDSRSSGVVLLRDVFVASVKATCDVIQSQSSAYISVQYLNISLQAYQIAQSTSFDHLDGDTSTSDRNSVSTSHGCDDDIKDTSRSISTVLDTGMAQVRAMVIQLLNCHLIRYTDSVKYGLYLLHTLLHPCNRGGSGGEGMGEGLWLCVMVFPALLDILRVYRQTVGRKLVLIEKDRCELLVLLLRIVTVIIERVESRQMCCVGAGELLSLALREVLGWVIGEPTTEEGSSQYGGVGEEVKNGHVHGDVNLRTSLMCALLECIRGVWKYRLSVDTAAWDELTISHTLTSPNNGDDGLTATAATATATVDTNVDGIDNNDTPDTTTNSTTRQRGSGSDSVWEVLAVKLCTNLILGRYTHILCTGSDGLPLDCEEKAEDDVRVVMSKYVSVAAASLDLALQKRRRSEAVKLLQSAIIKDVHGYGSDVSSVLWRCMKSPHMHISVRLVCMKMLDVLATDRMAMEDVSISPSRADASSGAIGAACEEEDDADGRLLLSAVVGANALRDFELSMKTYNDHQLSTHQHHQPSDGGRSVWCMCTCGIYHEQQLLSMPVDVCGSGVGSTSSLSVSSSDCSHTDGLGVVFQWLVILQRIDTYCTMSTVSSSHWGARAKIGSYFHHSQLLDGFFRGLIRVQRNTPYTHTSTTNSSNSGSGSSANVLQLPSCTSSFVVASPFAVSVSSPTSFSLPAASAATTTTTTTTRGPQIVDKGNASIEPEQADKDDDVEDDDSNEDDNEDDVYMSPALLEVLSYTLHRTLCLLPILVRKYWAEQCNRGESLALERFVLEGGVNDSIVQREIGIVEIAKQQGGGKLPTSSGGVSEEGEMHVSCSSVSREVTATFIADEVTVELTIRLPALYPLRNVEVDGRKKLGISEKRWRRWTLQIIQLLSHQDGSVLDAVLLWKRNVDKEFDGVEPCPICYSILHPKTLSMPTLVCKTCSNKFHSACLYKWFSSSGKSKCVICQQPFF